MGENLVHNYNKLYGNYVKDSLASGAGASLKILMSLFELDMK